MKKIEIIALLTDSKKIIELLQRRGIIEPQKIQDDELIRMDTRVCINQFEKNRELAQQALGILNERTHFKPPLTASLSGKREYERHAFGEKTTILESTLRVCGDILDNERRINDLKNEISHIEVNTDELRKWEKLDIPPDFGGTKETSCFIGTVNNRKNMEYILGELQDSAYIETVSSIKEQTNIVVICHRDDKENTVSVLRHGGFARISEADGNSVSEVIAKNEEKVAGLKKSISDCEQAIVATQGERENIEFVIDYLSIRCDKYKALNDLAMTETTFMLEGYIPEKYAQKLVDELEGRFTVVITLTDPEEDDDVPVMLENSKFSAPVESITEMYALPNKRDVDPTSVMAFFYYLFFGMMLSDAGYGIVMVLVTSIVLHKFKLEDKMQKTMRMFQYSGISTVFWGALFGSWFGDLPQTVAKQFFGKEIGSLALWFEPLEDPIKLLVFSFGLGIAHLFWGLAVNFKKLWKEGKKADAIFDVIPIYLAVLGVAPLAAGILISVPESLKHIGKYLAIVGAALIVLTSGRSSKSIIARFAGGLYGLYNTATGYLSDILSYSRLLALGLATGSIASVINLIGTMPSNMAVKAVMFTVVFIVGHTANMAINLLGAYVHTDRLQFVELFSKFYEGGGRKFEPLGVNTKYIKFTEEK